VPRKLELEDLCCISIQREEEKKEMELGCDFQRKICEVARRWKLVWLVRLVTKFGRGNVYTGHARVLLLRVYSSLFHFLFVAMLLVIKIVKNCYYY